MAKKRKTAKRTPKQKSSPRRKVITLRVEKPVLIWLDKVSVLAGLRRENVAQVLLAQFVVGHEERVV